MHVPVVEDLLIIGRQVGADLQVGEVDRRVARIEHVQLRRRRVLGGDQKVRHTERKDRAGQ